MMNFFLLSCTLPGNIEKEILTVKSTLLRQTGLASALVLPSLLPIQWFRDVPNPEGITIASSLSDYGVEEDEHNEKNRKKSRFTTGFPRIEKGIWWLPVIPLPGVIYEGKILSPSLGIPLLADPSGPVISGLSYSSGLTKEDKAALEETLNTIPPLSWKVMELSCFTFRFPSTLGSPDASGTENGAGSLNREPHGSLEELWETIAPWEEGVEWEETWRLKKPLNPGN